MNDAPTEPQAHHCYLGEGTTPLRLAAALSLETLRLGRSCGGQVETLEPLPGAAKQLSRAL